jgi:transposase InsO family protein
MKCEAIFRSNSEFSVRKMCKYSGYCWLKNEEKRNLRRLAEKDLVDRVINEFEKSKKTYGSRKMKKALENEDIIISEWKIRRIMRENALYSVVLNKYKPYRKGKTIGQYSENILARKFTVWPNFN